jgi:sugar phosphate isomerase/epimerase
MLRGLTGAGLGKRDSDLEWISKAAAYGFAAVDTSASGLIHQLGSLDAAKQYLDDHHVQLGSIGLSVEWRGTDDQFRDGLAQFVRDSEAAASLGCQRCCTYVLPSTDLKPAPFMTAATKRLRVCAEILEAYGIRLGLEFVGPHHLRTRWANPFIWTMQETLDWIDAIGRPNVGLLLDAYHWYTNEMSVDELYKLRVDQIVHVHINDAPDVPVAEVLDNGRLYPGEGVIDLTGFLGALRKIGYTGPITQEILTAAPPEQSLEELLERSKRGFDKVFGAN